MPAKLTAALPKAVWTKVHLAELERMFPEQTKLMTPDELSYRAGQRSVVQHVRHSLNSGEQPNGI